MIEAKNVSEVRQILASDEFNEWYRLFESIHAQLQSIYSRAPDRLVHEIFRAGEYEDLASQAAAEFTYLDSSFEDLGLFEVQRQRTSQVWASHGRAEYMLAEQRQKASQLRSELRAFEKTGGEPEEKRRIEDDLRHVEELVAYWDQEESVLKKRLDEESARRDELWRHVQEAWGNAFSAKMASIEYHLLARRARAEIDSLSKAKRDGVELPSDESADLEEQTEVLKQQLAQHLEHARDRFSCALVAEYLYWPHRDDMKAALCVPLHAEERMLNLQVVPLRLYRVEREKGLHFVEPVPEEFEAEERDDERLESFFLDRPAVSRGQSV